MRENLLKRHIDRGEVVLAAGMKTSVPEMVEILGSSGFQGSLFDMEHGDYSLESIAHNIRAAEAVGITPLVRVADTDPLLIGKLLDMGIQGILFPRINDAEQARLAVTTLHYPPDGIRGACPNVRALGYDAVPWDEYCAWANRETLAFCLIETREAVDNIDEILAVDGIDVICGGPFDLSVSLGVPGQMNHRAVKEALTEVVAKARERGIPSAALAVIDQPELSRYWLDQGVRLFISSFAKSVAVALRGFREQLEADARQLAVS